MVNVMVQSKGKKRVVKVDKGDYDKYVKGHSLSLLYTQGHAYARIDRNRLLHRVIKKAPPALSCTTETATNWTTSAQIWSSRLSLTMLPSRRDTRGCEEAGPSAGPE